MKQIEKIQNEIRGYEDNSEDPVGALANSEYRLKDIEIDDEDEEEIYEEKISEELKTVDVFNDDIELNFTDEEIDQAIAEFNEIERLEALEESLEESLKESLEEPSPEPDEAWDVGIDPIDKDDEPVYQTDSKELDKMLDIVDDVIDEKKK
jgi:hypothetical protein